MRKNGFNIQELNDEMSKMNHASIIRELNLLRGKRNLTQEELKKIEILSKVSREKQAQRNKNFDW